MSYEPVDLYIKDTSPAKNPIEGVVVRVFSQDGRISYTQTTTDSNGKASFLLPSSLTFQIRMFKQHLALPNPKYIVVFASPAVNVFDVAADVVSPPTTPDPRLCVAYGYFRRPDGSAADSIDLHFIAKFKPLLLDGDAVLVERAITRTDEKGYAQINLIRYGKYDVTVQGTEDYQRCISVPNAPSVNLPDLLFPVVERVTFSTTPPTTLAVGAEVQLTPTIYGSDGNALDDSGDVQWSSSDPNILAVLPAGGVLTLRGVSAGTASLQAVRADQSIVRIPNTPIRGVPVTVTVE